MHESNLIINQSSYNFGKQPIKRMATQDDGTGRRGKKITFGRNGVGTMSENAKELGKEK
jgi:hypothetical protein